jgi:hypothetical protein
MFRDPEQWAVNTNNDIPEHFLRDAVFERYLNASANPTPPIEVEGGKVPKKKPEPTPEKVVAKYDEEDVKASREVYSQSLKLGEWLGDITDAMRIGMDFRPYFSEDEKEAFRKQAKVLAEKANKPAETNRTGEGTLRGSLNRISRRYEGNNVLELAVISAVNKKIKEPWK